MLETLTQQLTHIDPTSPGIRIGTAALLLCADVMFFLKRRNGIYATEQYPLARQLFETGGLLWLNSSIFVLVGPNSRLAEALYFTGGAISVVIGWTGVYLVRSEQKKSLTLSKENSAIAERDHMPTLVVSRGYSWVDAFRVHRIIVDGKFVAKLNAGGEIRIPVAPGIHNICATIDWCRSAAVSFEATGTDTLEFRCRPRPRGINPFVYIKYTFFDGSEYLLIERVHNSVKRARSSV